MKKSMNQPDTEPEQKRFELPSEGEHQFQVVDILPDANNPDIVMVKLEVADGEELGRSILHRVNLDENWKGFFLTRLFLKAIGEPYKGAFDADSDMWIGKQFYETIVHNKSEKNGKTYANIDEFIFDKTAPLTPNDIKFEE
jgi:hypothetical protein